MLPTPKSLFICDLEPNTLVQTLFLVEERVEGQTRRGDRYLKLRLADRTGTIEGRVWSGAPGLDAPFEPGDVIAVQARAEPWRGVLQLNVAQIERLPPDQVDVTRFVPTSRFETKEMLAQLRGLVEEEVRSRWIRELMGEMLRDAELEEALSCASASRRNHHNVRGGLLEHTLSMVRLSSYVASHYERYYPGLLNRDLLIAGAILHDMGKVIELSPAPGFAYTDEGELLGHIVSGIGLLGRWVERVEGFPAALALQLKHMIAAHHGRLEYGSPVRPKLIEAIVLHEIDMIDARVAAFHNLIRAEGPSEQPRWSSYNALFAGKMMLPPADGYAWSPPPRLGDEDLDGPGRCWWERRAGVP